LWLTLLESLALYSAVFGVMFAIEAQRGQLANQAWQFWVIMICLWIVLAFPAAAWFKLRKQ
jgi:type III secretory pathway component EscS